MPPYHKRNLTYLALGDSYTIGEGVPHAQCWPMQLVNILRCYGWHFATPHIIAQTGWTTADLQRALDQQYPTGPYDLVTLLIGVNNQYRGHSITHYRHEFAHLLQHAIGYAHDEPSHVIVLSIPDWGITPFAATRNRAQIATEIAQFNMVNYEESLLAGTRYVNITPASRSAANDETLLVADQLHPSAKMYTTWVNLLLPKVRAILGKQPPQPKHPGTAALSTAYRLPSTQS